MARFFKPYQIGEGLKRIKPDICVLNEIVYGNFYAWQHHGQYKDSLASICQGLGHGQNYYMVRQPFGYWEKGEALANALLSRFPIINSYAFPIRTTDYWPAPNSQRSCLVANLRLSESETITIIAVHAMGCSSQDSIYQVAEIKAAVQSLIQAGQELIFVMGDFNMDINSAGYQQLIHMPPKFIDTFNMVHSMPQDPHQTRTSLSEDIRIDHILQVSTTMQVKVLTAEIIFREENDAYHLPLVSDHFGLLVRLAV